MILRNLLQRIKINQCFYVLYFCHRTYIKFPIKLFPLIKIQWAGQRFLLSFHIFRTVFNKKLVILIRIWGQPIKLLEVFFQKISKLKINHTWVRFVDKTIFSLVSWWYTKELRTHNSQFLPHLIQIHPPLSSIMQ